jgi:protocatechuate 3,4-dioxygenase beta subunit
MSTNDDEQIGRLLGRRDVFRLLGMAGVAAVGAACGGGTGGALGSPSATSDAGAAGSSPASTSAGGLPACVAKPALGEGPFFVDEKLKRSDIRTDPSGGNGAEGVPLELTFIVSQIADGVCTPLEGATVDVWHCDAEGRYSDEEQNGTAGQKFLRGYQTTNKDGRASFTTIYPGWYQGRAVHIHFKIRTGEGRDFTSQLFFDDELSDEIFAASPYKERGTRDVRNSNDGIFGQSGGQLTLSPKKSGDGYAASFEIGLELT